MPQMGTSVAEGTIVAWKVAVGDPVARDQVLCEVSTDKVDVECPAAQDGVLAEILVEAGETVDVGTVIARLAPAGADAGAADARAANVGAADVGAADVGAANGRAADASTADVGAADVGAASAEVPIRAGAADSVADESAGGRAGALAPRPAADPDPRNDPRAARREALRRSSPVAARLAAEHGVDVLRLEGTGRNGRVTKRDVLAAAGAGSTANGASAAAASATPAAPDGTGAGARPVAEPEGRDATPGEALMHTESPYRHDPSIPVAGAAGPGTAGTTASSIAPPGAPPVVPTDLGGVPEPVTRMRRSIGSAVRRSLDTAAHCTTIVECDMSRVERERRELGLTALPLLARHAIETLQAFPALNATFDGETVTRYGERVHLGIAVSLGDDGLIAPVIHDAQDLSVQGLARRIRDLATRARAGRLSPDEVRGGTFTITNPGAAGALMATPVINLPQVAILDLEAIVRRPVVVTDAEGQESIGIRPMVHLCMGWDHRALDGLYAAQFLTALRRRVEG
jgi:pyruvate/2-oxoglutarate dehydrogenase complex dihydrolipoamide acyltransferase (E2) component